MVEAATLQEGQQHKAGAADATAVLIDDSTQELTEQELDAMISDALDCPCVKDLRDSPCGPAFEAAFTCFHKSRDTPKGLHCVEANMFFAECLRQHPAALESLQAAGDEAFDMPAPPPPIN